MHTYLDRKDVDDIDDDENKCRRATHTDRSPIEMFFENLRLGKGNFLGY